MDGVELLQRNTQQSNLTTARRRNRLRRNRRVTPIRERKGLEVRYRRMIIALFRQSQERVQETLFNSGLIQDTLSDDIRNAFSNLRAIETSTPSAVGAIVRQFTQQADEQHKRRFYDGLQRSFGVNVQGIIQEDGLEEILTAAVEENVSLIKSIPNEYYDKVEQAVFRNIAGGGNGASLQNQIKKIGKTTDARARLIARDQNAKLNGRLNRGRQEALGVEEYIWVTSRDERVRSTHRDNNGKTFRWDNPPSETGHPGEDIQCRCVAQPVIEL